MKKNLLPTTIFLLAISVYLLWLFLAGCSPVETPISTPTSGLPSELAVLSAQPPIASPTPPAAIQATANFTPLPPLLPTPTESTTLSPETPTAAELSLPAGEVAFNGVRFSLDEGLAHQIYPYEETWDDMTYRVFKFAPQGLCREVGCIEVYDVAAYEAALPDFPLPPVGAATILSAQNNALAFQNGDGTRTVLMRGQDGYFANNEALLYEFKGFTDDGRFYILVTVPIDAPILLSSLDPSQNSNPNAIPVPDELPTDYIELSGVIYDYNQEIARQLELLAAVDFTPGLDVLDGLVISLQIEEPSPLSPTATPQTMAFVGPLQQVTTLDPTLFSDVVSLRIAADGRIWVATTNQYAVWGNGRWQTFPPTDFRIRDMLPAANGDLWLASDSGLFIFDDPGWTFLTPADLSMSDPLDPEYFTKYVVAEVGSQVWVGRCDWGGPGPFGGGGARWFDGIEWQGGDSVVADGCVTIIREDNQGRVWVTVDNDLWRYDPVTDVWQRFAPPEPPPDTRFGYITDLAFDLSGNPWPLYAICGGASCGGSEVRYQLQDETWIQVREDGAFPQRLFFDSAGTSWLILPGGGVMQYQTDPLDDSLVPNFMVDAVSTNAGGQIWLVGRADGGEAAVWLLQPEIGSAAETAVCPVSANSSLPVFSVDAPGQSIAEIFAPQIMAYLDAGGDMQGLAAQIQNLKLDIGGGTIWQPALDIPLVTDVTGDELEEVILSLLYYESNQYFNGEIFVFRCQNGGYVGGSIASIAGGVVGERPDITLLAVLDMNDNGRAEIVFTYVTVVGTNANFTREVRIMEWDGAQFRDLIRSDGTKMYAAQVLNATSPLDIMIADIDGDGFIDLQLTNGAGRGPDADESAQPTIDVWLWDGTWFVLSNNQ